MRLPLVERRSNERDQYVTMRRVDVERLMEGALSSAGVDELTGLWNRDAAVLLYLRAQNGLRRAGTIQDEKIGFVVVDLAGLKGFNDNEGRQVGDGALKKVARLLAKSSRESEDIVARVGGDEFLLVCPGGQEVAEKINDRLQHFLASKSARFRAQRKNGDWGRYVVKAYTATAEVRATVDPNVAVSVVCDVINKKGRDQELDVGGVRERLRELV